MFQFMEDRSQQIQWLRQRNQHITLDELVDMMDYQAVDEDAVALEEALHLTSTSPDSDY